VFRYAPTFEYVFDTPLIPILAPPDTILFPPLIVTEFPIFDSCRVSNFL